MKVPGIVIAGTGSGSGKTVTACALMNVYRRKGLAVRACKCGPDYIDPMFHREVLGVESENLDLFFCDGRELQQIYANHAEGAGLVITEGVMGFYDGMSLGSEQGSTYAIAKALQLPILLVVDARGMGASLLALLKGMLEYREDSGIRGILLNRVSASLYPRLKAMVESGLAGMGHGEIKVVGHIPVDDAFALENRHLGLMIPEACENLKERLDAAGDILSETIDLDAILKIAAGAGDFACQAPSKFRKLFTKIAVARDEAFCFYYPANLKLMESMGAGLVYFSPLRDQKLPDCDGILLGGGYPESHAEKLSGNRTMISDLREKADAGIPILAECGGFLYLQETLEDEKGSIFPMAGVLPGRGYRREGLKRFGYVTLSTDRERKYLKHAEAVKGHEFHYWESTKSGESMRAVKPDGRSWTCMVESGNILAGFPHLYYPSNPNLVRRFLEAAYEYQKTRNNP